MFYSNEENIILNLVEEIYNAEKKISEIQIEQNKFDDNNPDSIEIDSLFIKKNNLINKKNKIINEYDSKLNLNEKEIENKKNSLIDINNQLKTIKNKLFNFDTINFKNNLLNQFILMNNFNDFFSNEQIDNIFIV